jgi:LysM repeat protein
LCVPLVVFCVASFSLATSVHAQSVAEAARQERARKAKEHLPPEHVYTNDDLSRAEILTPRDEARAEARGKNSPPPAAIAPPPTFNAASPSGKESLGEIARRYRREKAAREAEAALKKQQHFPMNLAQPAFASPKFSIVPRGKLGPVVISPRRATLVPTPAPGRIVPTPLGLPPHHSPFLAPRAFPVLGRAAVPRRRISPFEPRPLPLSVLASPVFRSASPRSPAIRSSVLPSRPAPQINSANLQPVTVRRGDTFWKFAREYLGHGSRWQELLAYNPGAGDPRSLVVGSVIVVPRRSSVSQTPPAGSLSPSLVVVRKGDNLWSIARSHLGYGSSWPCLARANPQILNPNLILPGQSLSVPAACGASP